MSAGRVGQPLATVLAWETVSSLGENAAETALLLRAGINNVGPSRFVDATGQRMMLCRAPAVPPDLDGGARVAVLAQLALDRLVGMSAAPIRPVLLLALPERYATGPLSAQLSAEGESCLEALRARLPNALQGIDIEAFPFGRASGAVALRRALALVETDRCVIWGGVDTLHDWAVLEALDQGDRLLTAENVDGVRPGEGAAFVRLGPADTPGAMHILGVGTGREPNPIGAEEPCHSEGLSAALEAAVEPLRAAQRRSNYWLLDNSHEAYATQELQNVIARFGDVLGLQAELQTPLQELGDVGAAAMPLLVVLCAEAWRLGFATDDTAVITGCSESGARGALLLAAEDGFRPAEVAP